ncbi:MAG: DUF721 domain-containing protein [Parachlamydiaceae bacterium]|nr:DUF721 domain-containing protein [Parachlamydiaceae bacterium]
MAKVFYSRIPRNYDGTRPTTRRMTDLIPQVLSKIGEIHDQRHDLILACWPEIIGPQLAGMTQAFSFNDGILVVKVRNSTLHSLLNQHEKFRILLILRKKFPHVEIKTIHFRIG